MTAVIFIIANIIYEIDELYTRSTCVLHIARGVLLKASLKAFLRSMHTRYTGCTRHFVLLQQYR